MSATSKELTKAIANLDSEITKKQAAISRMMDEIVGLMLRRERIKGALIEVVGAVEGTSVAQNQRAGTPRFRGKAFEIMIGALGAAGEIGLPAADLNKKVIDAGGSLWAAEKARTRLRRARMATLQDGRWRLTNNASPV
jgi:hypothetical protein